MGKRKKQRRSTSNAGIPQEEREQRLILAFKRWEVVQRLGQTAIWGGSLVAGLYVAVYLPIEASQGETTSIHFIMRWFTDFNLNVMAAWGAAASGVLWARLERRKRLREREERDIRLREFELAKDPRRTSSNLLPDGTESPEVQNGRPRST